MSDDKNRKTTVKKAAPKASAKAAKQAANPQMMDKLMRDLNRTLESQEFASEQEMSDFINQNFIGKKVGTFNVPNATPLDAAQDKIYEAYDKPNARRRIALAREALELSPDCADAYLLLGEEEKTAEEALKFYEQGLEAARRAIGETEFQEFAEDEAFWGFIETRPYMRARHELANALWELGRREEAVDHYEAMLKLNPNDNQGIRYVLAQALLKLERHERLVALLEKYKDDSAATWSYTHALLAFRLEGESVNAGRLLAAAFETNPHVPMSMIAMEKLPPPPSYVGFGDLNEAVAYIYEGLENWMETTRAVEWMLDEFTADKSNFSKAIAAMLPPNLINESKPTKRKSTKKKR